MKKYSPREVQQIVLKNLILIIIMALLGSICFIGYAKHKRTTDYTARCNIVIGHNLNNKSSKSKQMDTDLSRIKSYEDIIKDPRIARKARQYLTSKDKHSVTVDDVRDSVKVSTEFNSLVVTLKSKASTARLATNMVNATAKATKNELPKIVPDAGHVTIISLAQKKDAVSHTQPSYKKYAIVGFAFGALIGMVIAFVWTSWKHLLPEK